MSNMSASYELLPTVAMDSGNDTASDVINLSILTTQAERLNAQVTTTRNTKSLTNIYPTTTTTSSIATTTPTRTSTILTINETTPPPPISRYAAKRPQNLQLKISTTKCMPANNIRRNNSKLLASNQDAASATSETSATSESSATSSSLETPAPSAAASETSTTTIFPHEQYKAIKKLDIGFENISYTAKTGFLKRENKVILKGVTGLFRSGELSAIVGPSGAGKSTLLNVISSYTALGYGGNITINGNLRDIKAFKPNVAFITQDTSLQPHLTVKEAMHFSANLKIGTHMSKSAKRERVRKILEAIGMYDNRHTRAGKLSGGQKKRLSIALELVNNPPVLILDEPTSGLDSSTSNQCISLLKKLAMEGRTVICTIHQPSALTFEMFDHLYAVAEGQCIYSGGTQNLVPFLADVGLHCPESYNPSDYLLEIATDDYGKQNHKLVEKMQNGRNQNFLQKISDKKKQMEAIIKVDKMMASGLMTPVKAPLLTPAISTNIATTPASSRSRHFKQLTPINEMSSKIWESCGVIPTNSKEQTTSSKIICCNSNKPKPMKLDPAKLCKRENIYATPFYRQLGILLMRTFLILWRDKSLTTMRFLIHFLTALLIGCLYYDIGNDAGNALNNFRYIFYTIMFIMYCSFSSILVKFPLEFPIVSREHFNRWYSLRAYYVAITLADIPIQVICTGLFVLITYFMTNQPWELFRLLLFILMVFLSALVGQSIGLAVGASLNVQMGAILGPFFICPFLAFSGFFLQLKDAPIYFHWLFHSSFLKHSLDGSMLAIFGYNRQRLECVDMYCHYARPQTILKDLDMTHANYEWSLILLFILFILLRILAFYIMSFRLRLFR